MWKPGDLARIEGCPHWHHCGRTVTLIRKLTVGDFGPTYVGDWLLDLEPKPPFKFTSCEEKYLVPIDDGNEKGSWSDCVWQPKILERANG
jgi:hypothetical protein